MARIEIAGSPANVIVSVDHYVRSIVGVLSSDQRFLAGLELGVCGTDCGWKYRFTGAEPVG